MILPRCGQPPSDKAAIAAELYSSALPTLETERLSLRAPTMADLPVWTTISTEAFGDTPKEAWTQFSYYSAGWLLHGHGPFAAIRKSDSEILGFVLLGLEWGDHEPELGYFFAKKHHGQGYATEACAAVRDFGNELLGEGGFVSYVAADNARSNALAARLGATRDPIAESAFGSDQHVWRHGKATLQ